MTHSITTKTVVFWIKNIHEMTEDQIEKFETYSKICEEKGYHVIPYEIKHFMGSVWPNSFVHFGGYGKLNNTDKTAETQVEITDFIYHIENQNGLLNLR